MSRTRPIILSALYLTGIILAGVSLYEHVRVHTLTDAEPSFCNINALFNCDAVNLSSYSTILGIPIASYGLMFYSLLFALTVLSRVKKENIGTKLADTHFVLSLLAVLYSIYLFIVSEVLIGTLCLVCMGMYAVNAALLWASWRLAPDRSLEERIRNGAAAILRSPLALFLPGEPRALAWTFVPLGVVIVCGALALPALLADRIAESDPGPAHTSVGDERIVSQWRRSPTTDLDLNFSGGPDTDYGQGPPSAPIRIVEFADFECPMCRRSFFEIERVLERYQGKIHFIYKNYPIDMSCNPLIKREAHKHACFAALFARCAGEQGKFWPAVDYLLRLESLESGDAPEKVRTDILDGATLMGLDKPGLSECMQSRRQMDKLLDDMRVANAANIPGTPTIFVNGKQLPVPTSQALRAVINYILGAGSR